jgi:hypothetical protein
LQNLRGHPDLLKRMNSPSRESKIDRTTAYGVARARIRPTLKEFDLIATATEKRR